ncbi:MAG: DUF374 domain-containing protein [Deltaproteobacteria bacterium]|nr:DUF374 domain-containing protein [Deltaproteobacteria bacterium]
MKSHFRLPKIVVEIASSFLAFYTRLVYRFGEHREIGKEKVLSLLKEGRSVICPIWHQRLSYYLKRMGDLNALIMITTHPRLDTIARFCEKLGIEVVRGGSGDGHGMEALEEMARRCRQRPRVIALAPDGPAGPYHQARPGAVLLASKIGAPIVSVSWISTREHRSKKNWDHRTWAIPGGNAVFVYSEPLWVPSKIDPIQVSEFSQKLAQALDNVEAKVKESM